MNLQEYVPKSWDEIIGQDNVVSILKGYKTIGELPNFAFIGAPGTGKTACAYVLGKELGVSVIELNSSDERGIDVIREKVKTLLRTSGERIVLMDEADGLTNDSMAALRRPMELAKQNSKNRIIFTINRSWKVTDALYSRCTNLYFKPLSKESLTKIAIRVLKREGMKFKDNEEIKQIINALVSYSKGDARKLLDVIDNYSHSKESLIQYIQKRDSEVNLVREIFTASILGNWQDALMKLESYLIQSPTTNNSEIIDLFYTEIKELDIPPLKKFAIYEKLAGTERALKISCNPLIQLSGFLVSVMGVTHFKVEK